MFLNLINECPDILFQQLANLMVARHLISPLWLVEMKSDGDDDALLCIVALFVCGRQPEPSMGLEPLASSYSSTQVPCCRPLQLSNHQ